ncbi:MAG: MarR family winged helix-turn-helix transcriptional regulator [Sulfitobacter sp.]
MDQVDKILAQWRAERPDLDVSAMGVFGRIKRLSDHLGRALNEVFLRHGLNAANFDVLATLRRAGAPYALSPSELMEWTMVTSGTMTNRLDRLEAAGLIERRSNPRDGRGSLVALSPAGLALVDVVVSDHVANQQRLLEALPEAMRAPLDAALAAWLAAFEGAE